MSDALFSLVPAYGGWIVFLATFLSCLALPVPSSMIMLGAGAFAASGDLDLPRMILSAYVGAILGDHVGYLVGHRGGAGLVDRLSVRKDVGPSLRRASRMLERRGGVTVFLTRWLFSPLGPYVNFACGAAGVRVPLFSFGSLTGEAVWVVIYVGLGYQFASRIDDIAALLGNSAGVLAAGAVAAVLGSFVFRKPARKIRSS